MNAKSFTKKIEHLIIFNRTGRAIELLIDGLEEFDNELYKEAISYSSRYAKNKQARNTNTSSPKEIQIEYNNINIGILDLLEKVSQTDKISKFDFKINEKSLKRADFEEDERNTVSKKIRKFIIFLTVLTLLLPLLFYFISEYTSNKTTDRILTEIKSTQQEKPEKPALIEQVEGRWLQIFPYNKNKISICIIEMQNRKLVVDGRSYNFDGNIDGYWNSFAGTFNTDARTVTYLFTGQSISNREPVAEDNPGLGKMYFKGKLVDNKYQGGTGFYSSTDRPEKDDYVLIRITDEMLKRLSVEAPDTEREEVEFLKRYKKEYNANQG